MKSLGLRMSMAVFSLSMVPLLCSSRAAAAESDAQKSFDQHKTLAGTWQGALTVDPPMEGMKSGEVEQVSLRVTSRGNALVHEMYDPDKPDDPTRYDHPLTMLYLDAGRL